MGGFVQPKGATLLDMPQSDFGKPEKFPNQHCGVFGEFCHPVKNVEASLPFWKSIGFTVKYQSASPYPHTILTDGLMIISLHQTTDFDYPAITYFGINTSKRMEQLKAGGLSNINSFMGSGNQILTTWEGQHVFLFSLGF